MSGARKSSCNSGTLQARNVSELSHPLGNDSHQYPGKAKVVQTEDAQKFANQVGMQFYETDAKSNLNVDEPFYAITNLILTKTIAAQQHREACKRAMKENIVLQIRPVRFNNVGIPRSGKTSFWRRMMGEILNILWAIARGEKEQPSTGVAEAAGQVFIRNKTSADVGAISAKVWSSISDLGEEAGMLGQILYQSVQGHPSDSTARFDSSKPTISIATRKGSSKPTKRSGLASLKHSLLKALTSLTRGSSSGGEIADSVADAEIEEMLGVINEAIEAEDWDKVKYLLDDLILLINTDTGGQAEFLDLQASLVQGPSFNLLFSRLVDDLESLFEVYYTNEDGESTEKEDSTITVEEVLMQCLSSIACYSGAFSEGDDTPQEEASSSYVAKKACHSKSKVLFVGTYRDKVSQEEFEKKDKCLQRLIRGTPFYDKGIVEFASEDQLMLPVDNMSGGQDEIDRIREVLQQIIEKSFEKVSIPASWLLLSLQIRSKKLRTMSLEECEKLAQKVKINPHELQDALWFLHHRVGILLYYPQLEALKATVICDMQVVFDSATNLIKNTFTFSKVGQSVREKFRETAQFSLKEVKDATSSTTDALISLEKLVQLLEYLGILTAIPMPLSKGQEPTYFMPCVLKSARASSLKTCSYSDTDPAPLMLRFDCGYIPIGIFPSMIVNLVSQKSGGWEMVEEGLYKNRVQFIVGEDHDTITLISHPRYFEIGISRHAVFHSPMTSVCSHVRGVIQSTLSTITSRMNYHFSMGYKFGFKCPIHPGREHLCLLPKDARDMVCLENPKRKRYVPLDSKQRVWFPEENFPPMTRVLSAKRKAAPLSLKTLTLLKWKDEDGQIQSFRLVNRVSSRWMDFGLRLGFTINRMEGWKMEYQGNVTVCWNKVMELWLSGEVESCDYPTTWEGLYELLIDNEYAIVARDLGEAVKAAEKS